ncbi:MAG: Kazal-type serine protease inhibitor domain protein [Labilithrix sp.]|nr:Kazal-type serine protease inhibitor domain protein [Labilithrix sp.]
MKHSVAIAAAAFSVLGLLTVVACSGQSDDGTTGDDQEVRGAGKMCGGIAGLRCAAGLTCSYVGSYPDAAGTCVAPKPGEEGAQCGGIAALKCNPGLTCKIAGTQSSGPPPGTMGMPALDAGHGGPPPGAVGLPFPDASGTCVKSSGPPPGTMGFPAPPHR